MCIRDSTYTWQEYGTVILQILRDDGPDLMIVTEAGQLARYGMNQAGIALGVNKMCIRDSGELGADTTLTERFVEMGIDELSVAPSMVLSVRSKICEMA